MAKKQTTTVDVANFLLPLIAIFLLLGFFLWLPSALETLWLRRFFIYAAGGLSLLYILLRRHSLKIPRTSYIVLSLVVILSTIGLLRGREIAQGLIGQPILHPSLLSLYSSIAIGFVFASINNKKTILKFIYALIVLFGFISIVYWLFQGGSVRVGLLRLQINYSAYLLLLGMITGSWLYASKNISVKMILGVQTLLLFGILLSQSRLALLLAVLSFLQMIFYILPKQHKIFLFTASSVLVLILTAGLTTGSFNRLHNEHYFRQSIRYRFDLVRSSVKIQPQAFIFGGGVGSLERNISVKGQIYPEINTDLKNGWRFESSHNYFIDILVERGFVVILLYLLLFFAAIWRGLQSQNSEDKLLLLVLITTLLFVFFNNINIQIEVIVWCCIMPFLLEPLSKSRPKQTQEY